MKTTPKIFTLNELKEYLVRTKNETLKEMSKFFCNNIKFSSIEKKKIKLSQKCIIRFIKTSKEFKNWKEPLKAQVPKEMVTKVLKLMFIRIDLGKRFARLMSLRYYVNFKRGTVFWINLIRAAIYNLITESFNSYQFSNLNSK